MITKEQALSRLLVVQNDIEDMLKHHYAIRDDDPYYDDPAMWWGEVMLMDLKLLVSNQKCNSL